MKKQKINVGIILQDGLILFVVSTLLVVIANTGFDLLKDKGIKDDPLVTAIHQDKLDDLTKHAESGDHKLDLLDGHERTALMQASFVNYSLPQRLTEADEKRAAMVVVLLKNGAPVEALDKHKWTALMWASWSGMPTVVKELIKAEASVAAVGENGFTALTLAAMRGNFKIVEILLNEGADKSIVTKKGKSALDLAQLHMSHYSKKNDSEVNKVERYEKIIALLEQK